MEGDADELADEISSPQQRAYLQLTKLRAIVEDTALLAVPDAFTRDVIESRLRPAITEALSRRLNRPIQVAVTVKPPEDGTGLPGTVYGTPVETATDTRAEPQPRHYADPEPRRAEQPYDRDPYANPARRPRPRTGTCPPPAAARRLCSPSRWRRRRRPCPPSRPTIRCRCSRSRRRRWAASRRRRPTGSPRTTRPRTGWPAIPADCGTTSGARTTAR